MDEGLNKNVLDVIGGNKIFKPELRGGEKDWTCFFENDKYTIIKKKSPTFTIPGVTITVGAPPIAGANPLEVIAPAKEFSAVLYVVIDNKAPKSLGGFLSSEITDPSKTTGIPDEMVNIIRDDIGNPKW